MQLLAQGRRRLRGNPGGLEFDASEGRRRGRAGEPAVARGTDYVTAVYEASTWLLCASYYDGHDKTLLHFIGTGDYR